MANIFYDTTGNFSELTPKKVVAGYFTPNLSTNDYTEITVAGLTQGFTPSEAGDMVGVFLYFRVSSLTNDPSVTVKLQENDGGWGDVAGATCTILLSDLCDTHLATGHIFFEFGTPAAITTDADTWRIHVSCDFATSAYWWENGTNKAYGIIIDTGTTYSSGDVILFKNDITITQDQDITFGNGTTLGYNSIFQNLTPAASYTLAGDGDDYFYIGGKAQILGGTSVTPILNSEQWVLSGFSFYGCVSYVGQHDADLALYGEKPTSIHTFIASNATSGGNTIVTEDDMSAVWAPGDTVIVLGAEHATTGIESKIIDSISGTTVTLTTNLSYNHDAGYCVFNYSKKDDCGIKTVGVSIYTTEVWGRVELSGINIENSSTATWYFTTQSGNTGYAPRIMDTVFGTKSRMNFNMTGVASLTEGSEFKNIYFYDTSYQGDVLNLMGFLNATIQDVYIGVNSGTTLFNVSGHVGTTIQDVQISGGNGNAGNADIRGADLTIDNLQVSGSPYALELEITNSTMTDSYIDGGTTYGLLIQGGVGSVLSNCHFGERYSNAEDIRFASNIFAQYVVKDTNTVSVYNTENTVGKATDANKGTYVKVHNFNDTANDHRTWSVYGNIVSTGDGLSDTTVHTSGSGKFALRFEPLSSSNNLAWGVTIPTGDITDSTMFVAVWCKINSATYYAGTHQLPRLTIDYDDGTTAYAQAAETTDWQLLTVPFTPTTSYGQIIATISGRTDATTTNAYIYWDDFEVTYPPGTSLSLGGLDHWSNAMPMVPPVTIGSQRKKHLNLSSHVKLTEN